MAVDGAYVVRRGQMHLGRIRGLFEFAFDADAGAYGFVVEVKKREPVGEALFFVPAGANAAGAQSEYGSSGAVDRRMIARARLAAGLGGHYGDVGGEYAIRTTREYLGHVVELGLASAVVTHPRVVVSFLGKGLAVAAIGRLAGRFLELVESGMNRTCLVEDGGGVVVSLKGVVHGVFVGARLPGNTLSAGMMQFGAPGKPYSPLVASRAGAGLMMLVGGLCSTGVSERSRQRLVDMVFDAVNGVLAGASSRAPDERLECVGAGAVEFWFVEWPKEVVRSFGFLAETGVAESVVEEFVDGGLA